MKDISWDLRQSLTMFPLTLLLLGTPTYAQDRNSQIDKIFSWVTPATPGCTCAASLNGELVVNHAYGLADLERSAAPTISAIRSFATSASPG